MKALTLIKIRQIANSTYQIIAKVQYIDPQIIWKLPSLLVWMSHNTNCLIIHACALHVHKLNMQGADFWRVTEQEVKLSTRTQCV